MKTHASSSRRGVALVIVLVFVVLLSVFILSFFANSQNELSAAQSFSGQISAHQLAETASALVMGQVREATTQKNVAWASQPGMVRTYGNAAGTPSDKALAFYKLYSSDDMIIGTREMEGFRTKFNDPKFLGGEIPLGQGDDDKSGWENQPALYTDLNSPITLAEPAEDGSTVVKFPIIDGHDVRSITPPSVPANPSGEGVFKPVWSYDGVNDRGDRIPDGVADIEGFSVDMRTVKYSEPTDDNPLSPSNTPVPMPVRWMYVLRDGSLTVPPVSREDKSTKQPTIADWSGGEQKRKPTRDNPVVGRIAFWADDDSCKVNINTAGGFNYKDVSRSNYKRERDFAGSYWDQPRTTTRFDYGDSNDDGIRGEDGSVNVGGLSITQPIAREYQRYPGHPATTSLGLLFKDLLNSEQLYSILPRIRNQGTRGGTERIFAADPNKDPGKPVDETIPADEDDFQPMALKRDRIFASVDEFLFGGRFKESDPFRPLNDFQLMNDPSLIDSRLGARVYNDQLKPGQTAITPEILERMRFFLTAHSRAPELNLFGRPRVTIWPSYPDAERLNAPDRLLNFCSTIGPRIRADGTPVPPNEVKLFQYQRSDPYSPTADWDGQTNITPRRFKMPQTPTGGTRNQFLHRYLQDLTDGRVPGFAGGSFRDKYGKEDRDQILTSIFDYMRCVNMRDSTRDKYIYPDQPKNPPAAQWKEIERFKFAPLGTVVPIRINEGGQTSRGFGRFPIFSEAALVLYHAGYLNRTFPDLERRVFKSLHNPATGNGLNDVLNKDHKKTDGSLWKGKEGVTHNAIKAFLIFEGFNPMMGYAPTRTLNQKSLDRFCYVVEVDGLNQFGMTSANGSVVSTGVGTPYRLGLNFPEKAKNLFVHTSGAAWHGRNLGGSEGWLHMLRGSWHWGRKANPTHPVNSNNPPEAMIPNKWGINPPGLGTTPPTSHWYEFQSSGGVLVEAKPNEPDVADGNDYYQYLRDSKQWQQLQLSGAELSIRVRFGEAKLDSAGKLTNPPPVIQELKMTFPPAVVPVPTDHIWMDDPGGFCAADYLNTTPRDKWAVDQLRDGAGKLTTNYEGVKSFGGRLLSPPRSTPPDSNMTDSLDFNNSSNNNYGNGWLHGGCFGASSGNEVNNPKPGWNHTNRWRQLMQPGDTIRSVVLGVDGGDPRVAAINLEDSTRFYKPHPDYENPSVRHAQTLRTSVGVPQFAMKLPTNTGTVLDRDKYGAGGRSLPFGSLATLPNGIYYSADRWPDLPPDIKGVKMSFGQPTTSGRPGDFDTGLGNQPDGAYAGKSDEGNPVFRVRDSYRDKDNNVIKYWRYPHPYYDWAYEETFDTFFTPNRQTPSAVVFGSLPIGKNGHWTTLAFSPVSAFECSDASGKSVHPGRKDGFVRDHLLLDLFNMPIVEPYAISEPFSTAGKINLNYPMMPFTHIERSTAFRAALHSVRVSAFPNQHANIYKTGAGSETAAGAWRENYNYRYPVDRNLTVRAFRDFFDQFKKDPNLGLFKSASEICDRGLYPTVLTSDPVTGPKYTAPSRNADPDNHLKGTFWAANALTGDNMREKPYSDLYPRVTTKSNTFTVHVRAQSLRQTPQSAEQGVWDEKRDRVIGEYRGSSTIERFIDPEDARFDPQSSTVKDKDRLDVDKDSLEGAYRFRVISTKRFVP
jgi:hypothetical protein